MLYMIFLILAYVISIAFVDAGDDAYLAPLILAPRHEIGMFGGHMSQTFNNRYIVHLNRESTFGFSPRSSMAVLEAHRQMLLQELSMPGSKSSLDHTYDFDSFIGYSGIFESDLLIKIRKDPAVKLVEQDQVMFAFPDTSSELFFDKDTFSATKQLLSLTPLDQSLSLVNDIVKMFKKKRHLKLKGNHDFLSESSLYKSDYASRRPKGSKCLGQDNAPWGLSRVSYNPTYDNDFINNGTYWYPKSAGSNVNVYIVDTGINVDHEDFKGRARWGITIPQFDLDTDGSGHGTHCAGIVGGDTYGVAKNATLVAVKVLRTNGFGTNADVIKGVEWVFNQHRISQRSGSRSVINLSLGGGRSIALEKAIEACIDSGVHVAVAAGNDNRDACNYSPAATKKAITVGASTKKDKMAYFSNIGPCVDIFAPGMDITSAWIGSPTAINTISGTSMASPHVAGVLALHLGEKAYHPQELKDLLLKTANNGLLKLLPPDTANKLLSTDALLTDVEFSAQTLENSVDDLYASLY
ncbi:proteinase B [Mitosporidium daphniae]|uniref:Putative subtilisin-like serine protease n=1 Tax=Mitosporidium daphniae TaxID=1485682 RepID=A0A098VUJ9_9MICR|nr:putative subtilisin-like serine protease [Mitosporidium daphniae]KGG52630.1 putative subtilisin-like serine protease [Mitosporidium daphniae]|eukprot:XP_013239057.1 putative subtilisin-like serine protease [Mitosporidium daphniae]